MARDYYVGFRSEESIAQLANRLRGPHPAPSFNLVEFIEQELPRHVKKWKPNIEHYDREFPQDDAAYVTYDPLTLHADIKAWADCGAGESQARFVFGHEVGHIAMHDNSAKAFSSDKSAQIGFAEEGHSAEWQANTFAGHFLLPTSVVQEIGDFELIVIRCNVPEALALERVLAVRREQARRNRVFEGGLCNACGNFSLEQRDWVMECRTCGNTISRRL